MRNAFAFGGLLAASTLAFAAPALAQAGSGWVAKPGTTVNGGVVTLDPRGQPAGTSYENPNLNVALENGDTISFQYMGPDPASAVSLAPVRRGRWTPGPVRDDALIEPGELGAVRSRAALLRCRAGGGLGPLPSLDARRDEAAVPEDAWAGQRLRHLRRAGIAG